MTLANLTSIMVNFVGFAIPLLVPYYLARIGGYDATEMGIMLAAASAGVLAGSTFATGIIHAAGQRRATLLAAALVALAQGVIAYWPIAPSAAVLLPGLILHGAGIGLFQVSYADLVVASLHQRDRGVAGSVTVLTRTVGVIIGAAALTGALQALEAHHLTAGLTAHDAFHTAFRFVLLGSGLLLAGFVAISVIRKPH